MQGGRRREEQEQEQATASSPVFPDHSRVRVSLLEFASRDTRLRHALGRRTSLKVVNCMRPMMIRIITEYRRSEC